MAKVSGPQGTSPGVLTQIAEGVKGIGNKMTELVGKLANGRTVAQSDPEQLSTHENQQSQPETTGLSSYQVAMKSSEPHSQEYYEQEYDEQEYDELLNRPLGRAFEQDEGLMPDAESFSVQAEEDRNSSVIQPDTGNYFVQAEETRNSAMDAYQASREQTLKAREEAFNKRQAQSRLDILSKELEQDTKKPDDSLFDSKGGLMGEIETKVESHALERQLEMERNKHEDLRNEIRAKGAARDTVVTGKDGLIYENRYAAATAALDAKQAGYSSSVDGDNFTITDAAAAKYREMVAYEKLGETVDVVAQLRDKEQRWEAKAKKLSDFFAEIRKNHKNLYYASGFAAIKVISTALLKKLQSRIAKKLEVAEVHLSVAHNGMLQFPSYRKDMMQYHAYRKDMMQYHAYRKDLPAFSKEQKQASAAQNKPIRITREDGVYSVHPASKKAGSRRSENKHRTRAKEQEAKAYDTRTDQQRRSEDARDGLRTKLEHRSEAKSGRTEEAPMRLSRKEQSEADKAHNNRADAEIDKLMATKFANEQRTQEPSQQQMTMGHRSEEHLSQLDESYNQQEDHFYEFNPDYYDQSQLAQNAIGDGSQDTDENDTGGWETPKRKRRKRQ